MSKIAPRPWKASDNSDDEGCIEDARGDFVVYDDGRPTGDEAKHIVACVNAIHAAGITPEALAADPECLKRLVDTSERTVRVFSEEESDFADVAADTASALRACGIEVMT